MKKIILFVLCACLTAQNLVPVYAVEDSRRGGVPLTIEYEEGNYNLSKDHPPQELSSEIYVRIRKRDLDEIRRQAFLSGTILQKIRDLEKLYKDIRTIIETINATIVFIKKFLNIEGIDIFNPENGSDGEFEHVSGVIMSPGYVEILAKTTDPKTNFDKHGIEELEMDIYYNKTLFNIDHLEGDGIVETEYRIINVSSKTSGSKDRLVIPLSDVLTNQTKFRLYLAPRNPDLIKVGDSTKLDVRYFKRPVTNQDGEKELPLEYGFAEGSATEIKVTVK